MKYIFHDLKKQKKLTELAVQHVALVCFNHKQHVGIQTSHAEGLKHKAAKLNKMK